ncbi:endonuclease VII domain-containing protein [Streptomyces sp. NBC_01764]|nr:endonuclease domain-containing protein [Streptomyces sp. NBC_01764]MCX4401548.1 endonuclease VII domain-containing protein [Streptomyces sp. NBC_01764]MCX5089447.1 endonuclease VII domain-containing protein [Streptomyces sp. NBC_00365]
MRLCKRDDCGQRFRIHASSNKRYCSPGCRWACPKLRKLLEPSLVKHQLSDVDESARSATCSVCGPTSIRRRTTKTKHPAVEVRWRCRTAERARDWARQYGLDVATVLEMLEGQERGCAICGRDVAERFYIDHCHASGAVRGILCSNCNTALGLLGDDVERMEAAIQYLKRARAA